MNPLLIRRHEMIAQQGGLPYDAEIEYLEGTGTQYIDTGISGARYMGYEIKLEWPTVSTGYSNYPVILGAQESDTSRRFTLMAGLSNSRIYFNSGAQEYYRAKPTGTPIIKKYNQSVYINGTSVKTFTSGAYTTPNPIVLYNFSNNGVVNKNRGVITKIYYFKMYYEPDELLLDFIPVRVGTVGYMYDRVSGQLFGNAGTDAFVLGPDVQS